jgi:rSAM/selenodomain-associated transferase 2
VIVPVLNEAANISATLACLQALRACGAEVILVDGGSSDATLEISQPLVDRQIHSARGRANQMNAGAAAARGDILLFLHADTRLPPDALGLITRGLTSLSTTLGTGSDKTWGRFDVHIDGKPRMLRLIAAMMNLRSRLSGIATGDQAIFIRRTEFVAVGGFPDLALMEDIEISTRLKRRSRPLCLRQKVATSGRRWVSRGVWRTILLMWRLRLLYWCGVPAEKLLKEYQ